MFRTGRVGMAPIIHNSAASGKYHLAKLTTMSNATANEALRIAKNAAKLDSSMRCVAYRVEPEGTGAVNYENALKRAMHRDFPVTGDDGGYGLVVLKNPKDIQGMIRGTRFEENKALEKTLIDAAKLHHVYGGRGTGNNTYADILAVVDKTEKEFFYLLESNFGSDS